MAGVGARMRDTEMSPEQGLSELQPGPAPLGVTCHVPPGTSLPPTLHTDLGIYHSALGVGAAISGYLLCLPGLLEWGTWGGAVVRPPHHCRDLDEGERGGKV